MASLNLISVKSGTSRHSRRTGSTSGLASFSVREEGSGHYGKSSKYLLSKIRIATWNVATLKKRSNEVVETLSRRYIDICGIQKHRGSIAWSNSPLDRKKLKVVQAFYCPNNGLIRYLKLSVYLSYCFKVDYWWGCIFLLIYICSSIWSIRDRTILQTTVSKMPVSESLIIVGDWNWHVGKIGIWLS